MGGWIQRWIIWLYRHIIAEIQLQLYFSVEPVEPPWLLYWTFNTATKNIRIKCSIYPTPVVHSVGFSIRHTSAKIQLNPTHSPALFTHFSHFNSFMLRFKATARQVSATKPKVILKIILLSWYEKAILPKQQHTELWAHGANLCF